jgi:hypothetical protein
MSNFSGEYFDFDEAFWLVACTAARALPRGRYHLIGAPKYIHETEAAAEAEAVRLARLNPDHRFAVLRSQASVQIDKTTGAPKWADASIPRWKAA